MIDEEATTVYRMYSSIGMLLYVGITGRKVRRLKEHMLDKPWWQEAETVQLEHFKKRSDAERRERELIKAEKPIYNVVHAARDVRRVPGADGTPNLISRSDFHRAVAMRRKRQQRNVS